MDDGFGVTVLVMVKQLVLSGDGCINTAALPPEEVATVVVPLMHSGIVVACVPKGDLVPWAWEQKGSVTEQIALAALSTLDELRKLGFAVLPFACAFLFAFLFTILYVI